MLARQARRSTQPLPLRPDAARSADPALWLLKPLAQAIALCLMAGSAEATTAFSSGWFAAKGAAQQAAAARPGGLPGMTPPLAQQQRARQQLQRSVQTLNNTVAAIAAQQAAQAAGRAAAFATVQFVPDGLGEGGLKVDTGLTKGWQNAKGPQQSQAGGKTTVKIEQTADKAILNWETFNVGRNTSVEFVQQSNWAVLNRINDPSARPSQIQGQIKGDGTVMLINRNGIVFSGTSQVNVRNLVAAATNITDIQFRDRGLYVDSSGSQPTFTDAAGKVLVARGARIETHNPKLSTDAGGYALLLGSEVENAGSISTAKGQTVLAAGDRFFIRKGSGTGGNGFSTTFGSEVVPGFNPAGSGKVSNSGLIQAATGDITMTGHQVLQNGVLLASTSVSTRGTIHLLNPATDTTGSVTLGKNSVSAILLDNSDFSALDSQHNAAMTGVNASNRIRSDQSRIDIGSGGTVEFQNGSITLATGGQVAVAAGLRSLVRDGAVIDVSGAIGVKVAMEANNIKINVQGNEQRDAAVNRENGGLNSNDLWVDVRELVFVPAGTNGYATDRWYTAGGLLEVGGYLGTQGHSIGEWMAQGGTVSFSGNDVVTEKGSLVNLSGGTLDVQSGYIRQSWLRSADGRLYEVSRAPGDILYTGLYKGYEDASARWGQTSYYYNPLIAPRQRYETGYTVGRDAGQLVIATRNAVLDGQLLGEVFDGERQNQAPRAGLDGYAQAQTALARRAQLIIGSYDPTWIAAASGLLYRLDPMLDQVHIGGERPADSADTGLTGPVSAARSGQLFLDTDLINGFRLGALKVSAKDTIDVKEALAVDSGGDITLYGPNVQIGADLTARGGSLHLGNVLNQVVTDKLGDTTLAAQTGKLTRVTVAEGVHLDTRGLWSNLRTHPEDGHSLAYLNGGLVSIRSSGDISLAKGSAVDVSSGAAVLATGKTRGGKGGDIGLESSALAAAGQARLILDGELHGYGVTGGGTLTLQADKVLISQSGGPAANYAVELAPSLFNTGFSAYRIVGINGLDVADGTVIDVSMPVYRFDETAPSQPSGSDPRTALQVWTPTLFQENPVKGVLTQRAGASLSLQAGADLFPANAPITSTLTIGQGSRLSVDPGQRINLRGPGQITIDGELNAWGGTIDIRQQQFGAIDVANSIQTGDPIAHNRSIWIGEHAVLDVAGRANTATDTLGRTYGLVGRGGSIIIGGEINAMKASATSADAYVIVRKGARLEASGAAAVLDIAGQGPTLVATDGGRIGLSSYNGLFIEGSLHAAAGGAGAAGGSLEIALDTPFYATTEASNDVRVPREMIIGQGPGDTLLPVDLRPGEAASMLRYGRARLSADQLMSGGFGNLTLFSNGLMTFDGDVNLHMNQSLSLYSGSLSLAQSSKNNARVNLSAPYLRLSGMGNYFATDGRYRPRVMGAPTSVLSAATFKATANLLDISNTLSFGTEGTIAQLNAPAVALNRRSFDLVTLDSSGDMRFLAQTDVEQKTRLWTAGDMHLRAAQIYPASDVKADVRAGYQGAHSVPGFERTLRISSHGPAPTQLPYSVFGNLLLAAGKVEQGGVIRAPLGWISLGEDSLMTTQQVHLLPGSVTSVSGAGLVMPYGGTTDGIDYRYNGKSVILQGIAGELNGVSLTGQYVDVQNGATINLSGGGDLRGAGFVSGRGGSTDARYYPLVRNAADGTFSLPGLSTNPVYAIVPGNQSAYAPMLGEAGAVDSRIGQQITIGAGVPGLAAGTYTLLPSTFALLPGAFRVEVNGQATGAINGALSMRNGSWTSAGLMSIANTGVRDSFARQVILTSGDVLRQYSQYNETGFTQFVFSDAARRGQPRALTPMDGKSLFMRLTRGGPQDIALNVDGKVLFNPVEGGVAGAAVVTSGGGGQDFEILRAGASRTQGFTGVSLYADTLNNLNAGRLSIGGVPTVYYGSAGGTIQFNGSTQSIILREGAILSAPEVLLNTNNLNGGITVEAGAGINTLGRGDVPYDSRDGFVYAPGKSGLLVVSNGWTNVLAPEAGGAGSIRIGTCPTLACSNPALLYSNGSIIAATDNQFELGDAVRFGTRHLGLAVGAVNAGSAEALAAAGNRVPAGLTLNQSVLNRLMQGDTQFGAPALETLSLTVRDAFNFFGTITLDTLDPLTGLSKLQNLVLSTPAIYGLGDANDSATIRTKNLIWNGATQAPGVVVDGGAGTGHGRLDIQAQRIEFGYGMNAQFNGVDQNDRLALGFANVSLNASERITSNHKGSLSVYEQQGVYDPVKGYAYSGGNLNLHTPVLTGEAGSVNVLKAGNNLTLTSPGGAAAAVADALGAQLTLHAQNVVLDGRITLASGKLTVKADDDLTLTKAAYLDLAGRTLPFNDVSKYSWGGDVTLYSDKGDIRQAQGSRIDLSANNNQAGNLSAVALGEGAGMVDLKGEILGVSSGYYDAGGTWVPYKAGGVDIRAQRLGSSGDLNQAFAALNQRLNAGQVFGSRSFQLKQGNLEIGDGLKAGEVNVSVDNGSLRVVGLIDASGERVGSIRLSAKNGLTLAGSAVLDAHGRMLRVDSYGKIIDAPNRAMVELNSGDGLLTLASGARIDLRHGTDVATGTLPGQHDGRPRGTLELYAPRLGAGDIAIDASGALKIQGARSIGLNATRRYTDAADGIDPTASGRPYQVIDQAYLDRIHLDSSAFIDAALANTQLLQGKLAGLNNASYADAFHLRPGVEIASKTADGDLLVRGDLDLSGYRYESLNPNTQKTLTPGSGESGSLLIRAGGNLDIYGSINDGFAPPSETVDDAGWKLVPGVQPFGGDLIVPGAGVTLAEGTKYPAGATLNYDLPIQAATLASGTVLAVEGILAGDYTFIAGTVLAGAVHDAAGNLLYAAGTLLSDAVTVPAGSRLGAGIRLNGNTAMQGMRWPKGVPLPGTFDADTGRIAGIKLGSSLALLQGSLIPSMTDVVLAAGTSYIDLRPFDGTQQGRNWALASMLPSGSSSWSMRVVAGADLEAADSRAVKPLTTDGNLRLADTHYGLNVTAGTARQVWSEINQYGFTPFELVPDDYLILCEIEATDCAPMARWTWAADNRLGIAAGTPMMDADVAQYCVSEPAMCQNNDPGIAVKTHTQMFSVLRTGAADLDLMAAGDLSMDSPFGVYTAGTQSGNIDPRYNQPRGRLSDDGSVLGSAGADYEKWVNGGSDSLYQAWFPQLGGNLTVVAGGSVSADVLGRRNYNPLAPQREQVPSVAVGNWLWRQGSGNNEVPTAWWINFGSYASQPLPDPSRDTGPYLVGFTGLGTLGGGNISLRVGGDAGMLKPMGDTINNPRGQGLIVAVGSTGRVASDGSLQLTGGGDMDIRVGGAINPSLRARAGQNGTSAAQHDLQGALINLRGAAQLTSGAVGGINLQYGASGLYQDRRELRPIDPFTATTSNASGGLVLVPGDSGMRISTLGDLVLGGAADPGRVRLQNSTPFTDANGVTHAGGGLSSFSLWTEHTAIDLFSAGGNLTPTTQMAETSSQGPVLGLNTSPTDAGFVMPSILRAVAAQGSIYVGPSAAFGPGNNDPALMYSLLLAPSSAGQLELLAGHSIYAGGYAINQSGASPLAIATPFAPSFSGYGDNVNTHPILTNTSADGVGSDVNSRYALFAFGPNTYSGLSRVQGPARFYAMNGDLVGIRSGETLNFETSLRTWYQAAGPVWMFAGRDIVASGTNLGQPTFVPREGISRNNEQINSTGNLFIHNNPNDVSRISAGRDILYSSFDIGGPGTLEINAGRNILMEDRATVTSVGPLKAGDQRPGANLVLQAGAGAQGPDYVRFIARYLDPKNLAANSAPLSAQPGKVVKTYIEELQAWLTLGYGFSGNEAQARAFFAALPSAEQSVFARQVYFAELRAGGLEYSDESGPRQGSYLRGRNAIAALFPTTDVAGNPIRYDGSITLFGGAGIKTLFGGNIQMLTPGGGQVFGVEGAAPPSTAGIVTQGSGDIQLYSEGSILLGQSRIMTTFGGGILGWSAEGDINAGRGSKTTVVFTPPKRVYDTWGNVTLSPTVPSTGAGIATLNPIPEVAPGDIDLIAPLGTIDAGEAGIRVSGNVNIIALRVVNAANIQVQGKSSGIPVTASVNTGAITSASSAATSATTAAQDMSRQQQAAARKNQASVFTVQVLSFGSEQLAPNRDGASRAPTPAYNPDSPVQVLGAGVLDERVRAQLTDEEKGNLML